LAEKASILEELDMSNHQEVSRIISEIEAEIDVIKGILQ
jgi:hypothetical protein